MQTTKKISEAPESNAGDDYHVLWTIKKSFDLLNFKENGLKAITIEGIDPKNANTIDPNGDKLLGVDIAEYFGGENFESANKVLVSQLKYSTRRASVNWTFAKLSQGKKSGSFDGSIIHRLAQIFKTFLINYGRELVLEKLTLKLVSNRNLSLAQNQIFLNFQKFLDKKNSKTFISTLIKEFPSQKTTLNSLLEASKLTSVEFTDFLRLLNFEDCGTRSSYYQEIEIITAIRDVGINNPVQHDSLFHMVWRKMLPDAIAKGENKITEIDLLHCFQMSMERLFPVSQNFELLENLVERNQVKDLISKILNNESGYPICIHGGAGIGKSIISQLIQKNIPDGSEVILFDCYGAGAYLNPSDCRHLHKEALLQIANEIAKKIGSPFLLSSDNDSHILMREFKIRVESAVNILKKRNPDSVLVLIVDAADNSITAAQKNQTSSFIQDLLNEPIPNGFRLVVTSRTYRIHSLNLPGNYIDLPLKPFNYEETKANLTYYFPESTEFEIQDFHKLTNGIPRVQTYVLGLKKVGIDEVINYLKPNGKSVEDLIQDRIHEAGKKLGANAQIMLNDFFTNLITLPRPVSILYIEILTGLSEELLLDLSTDIWHGLVLGNKQLSFRDEDFENFIRQKYMPNVETHKGIANLFLEKANTDEYASINLGIALFEANNEKKLKDIVLQEEYRSLPIDPIRNKEVYIERTKLAMKVCSKVADNLTFFKLVFIAAEVAKTDVAIRNLLIRNVDLVVSFGETESLQKVNLQSEGKSWAGSFNYQLAAIYSRDSNSVEYAIKHLSNAEKWMQWRQSQKNSEEYENYNITDEDIANGAEANLRIFGPLEAFNWLKRWSPKMAVFNATKNLIDNVLNHSENEEILKWLRSVDLPIYAKLMILEKIRNFRIPFYDLNEIAINIYRYLTNKVKFENYFWPTIISFCEQLIKSDPSKKEIVVKILETFKLDLPEYIPTFVDVSFDNDKKELIIDLFLRKATLKAALTGESLKGGSII